MPPEARERIEAILVELSKMNIYIYTAMKQIEEVWVESKGGD